MNLQTTSSRQALAPLEDLTRREFMFSALGAALVIACSDDEDEPEANETREFQDATGYTTQVPTRPQRIVVLHTVMAASPALSLEAPVVGLAEEGGSSTFPVWLTRYYDLEGVTPIPAAEGPDLEVVTGLNPDLILVSSYLGEYHLEPNAITQLRGIAPTVSVEEGRPVEEVVSAYADLLGLDEPEAQKKDFEAALAELKDVIDGEWSDVTVGDMGAFDFAIRAYAPDDNAWGAIIARLGATWLPLGLKDSDTRSASLERLEEFECDLLFLNDTINMKSESLFQQLQVVQAGQVIQLPQTDEFLGSSYAVYTACARWLRDEIAKLAQPLRTDIV